MKRLWHWLSGRPGVQRSAVAFPAYQQLVDDALAAAERDLEFARAQVIAARTGDHDRYPQMTDEVRDVCIGYLESMHALPDAEVRR